LDGTKQNTNYQLPITKWPHQSEAPVGAKTAETAVMPAMGFVNDHMQLGMGLSCGN
jgi:hypothetical protein